MSKILCALICLPLFVNAQERYTGVHFESGLSLQQVQEKAKLENKYIFMDCFATWCGPCRQMDEYVFPLKNVGSFFNAKFISVKMQMDTTKNDDELVRNHYGDVNYVRNKFKIDSYPTFIFLSPDGNLVYRVSGGFGETEFIAIGTDALKPEREYSTLASDYRKGKRDTSVMKLLAHLAKVSHDDGLAQQVAGDCMLDLEKKSNFSKKDVAFLKEFKENQIAKKIALNYINELKIEDLCNFNNINLIQTFTTRSDEKGFQLFYQNINKLDKYVNSVGFAESFIDFIITNEEIEPLVFPQGSPIASEPDWVKISNTISYKYDVTCSERIVTMAKIRISTLKQNWSEVTKNSVILIQKCGKYLPATEINDRSWDVFLYSTKKTELHIAIKWMKLLLQNDPENYNWMDTYANLLYKSGMVKDALLWEGKSLLVAKEDNAKQRSGDSGNGIKFAQDALDKMKSGKPTWTLQ